MQWLALFATLVLLTECGAPEPILPQPKKRDNTWGAVDPAILGTCSVKVHDKYLVGWNDGFAYRTWHPLIDPSGCAFAHEHGDNPYAQINPLIRNMPIRFGFAARRMVSAEEPNGHAEAHEGYKVFVTNRGDVNDEGRTSLIDARVVAHMGTAAPKRFVLRHHSLDVDVIDSAGKFISLRVMGDTGDIATLSNGSDLMGCDAPRDNVGVRAVLTLHPTCKQRPYEFWTFVADVGLAHAAISIAAFDPLTARDRANPLRLVPVWSSEVDAIMDFPGDPREHFRGCDRESYAGPIYWYNQNGPTLITTDPMGNAVAAGHPHAIQQQVSQHNTIDFKASADGLSQFKRRRNYCGPSLGLKN